MAELSSCSWQGSFAICKPMIFTLWPFTERISWPLTKIIEQEELTNLTKSDLKHYRIDKND
jgi:hypothetical protein